MIPLLVALLPAIAPADRGQGQGAAPAATRPSAESTASAETARAIDAIRRGLGALRAELERTEDGAVAKGDAIDYAPVGVTALAVLAFLGEGTAEGRGGNAPVVERAIRYLLDKSDRSGGARDGYIAADGDGISRMHGHGYATLALAEASGMFGARLGREGARRLDERLVAAVRLIERCQGEKGGWYYDPHRSVEHEGSVTVCLVQALRAARNAGVAVDKRVIDRGLDYLRASQAEDGSFAYQIGSDVRSAALTAAGVATLQAMGDYRSKAVESGIGYLFNATERQLASIAGDGRGVSLHPFREYERFYTAQAYFQYSDPKIFEDWFRRERAKLLAEQQPDGSWRAGSNFGAAYTTATNLLVLEIPLGVLPIFQR